MICVCGNDISSDTQEAEITDYDFDGASEIKPQQLPNNMNTVNCNRQSDLCEHSVIDDFEHQIKHEFTEDIHCCQICGQCFAHPNLLNAHISTVHSDRKVAVNDDKLGVQTKTRLSKFLPASDENPYRLRLRSNRMLLNDKNASDDSGKPHACNICDRRFRITRDLNLHMRTHSGLKPNSCSYCGKQFTTVSQMRSHHRTHTQEQVYNCGVCGEKFVWLNSLKRHMRIHKDVDDANIGAYSCSVCSKSFDSLADLESHMPTHGSENLLPSGKQSGKSAAVKSRQILKKKGASRSRKSHWSLDSRSACKVCGKAVVDMRKHMLTHSGEKRHQCILCGSCFSIAGTLTVHMRVHTGERPFGCDECGKSFTTRSHLTVHKRKHTREEPYQCVLCGEKFVWLNSMKRHMLLHDDLENPEYISSAVGSQLFGSADAADNHGNSVPLVEFTVPSEEFAPSTLQDSTTKQDASQQSQPLCEFCGKTFADMWKHRQMHIGRRHQCTHCGRCYTTAESLRTHMKIHTGEKKYVCAECGSRFRHMSHLRVHMRIHSEELHYECNICGEKFLWQNSLKRHRWKHDGTTRQRKHLCLVCSKSFFTAYLLRLHMQTHSGDKPYVCHQCGRRYASRSSLLCHQRYSHFAQPRPCPECGKQFKSLRVVKQHMRSVHRSSLHKCPHCGLEFRQRDWLDWHIITHSTQQPFTCDECQLNCNSETCATGLPYCHHVTVISISLFFPLPSFASSER